ncbi:MAG TPA: ATP-grasp domain-containing protein [Patescibacteria group bacterium]|jgi:hypothetical protein|nr:ATP-grasp domain-containing protein [Patescibacteria group bacterium]
MNQKNLSQSFLSKVITYDRDAPMGAVYDDQSAFVHLHRLFSDFVTVSTVREPWLNDLGLAAKSFVLGVELGKRSKTWRMASSKGFADLVKGMPRRKFVLFSPLDPPYIINPLSYVMNSPTIAHAYEHKRYFRDEFSSLINMPEHTVMRLTDFTRETYDELKADFGKFVMQDVESSGSKGTFIISKRSEYEDAVAYLKKTSYSGTVVISQFIKGQQYSVQVCVTKNGVFTGGLQKQLVDSKYLCNLNLPGVTRWCGGELGGEYSEILKHRSQEIATIVGSELASHGYRGIFGIDLIITPENDVYAIELNARLTGYTHVLSDMQYAKRKIPFILLHVLELANMDYEVTDLEALPGMNTLDDKFSYIILNNQTSGPLKLTQDIKAGLYRVDNDGLTFLKSSYSVEDIKDDRNVLIMSKFGKKQTVEKGKRVLKIIKRGKCMGLNGDLDLKSQRLLSLVKSHFSLPEGTETTSEAPAA